LRLTEKGYNLGLVSEERYQKMLSKKDAMEKELERLKKVVIGPTEENNKILEKIGTTQIKGPISLYELIRRPEVHYDDTAPLDANRSQLQREVRIQVETQIKYEGYIKKQMIQIEQFKKLENKKLS